MGYFTKEEFIRRVTENNKYVRNGDIEICGEYKGLERRLEYICHKCNTVQNPVAASLYNGNGCKRCGKIQSGISQRKTHEQFVEELKQISPNITTLGIYVTNNTSIEFMCEQGHVWVASPASILRGCGCPYCSGKRILVGYNDIATTSPDIFKFLANKDDGYKYTRGSNKRVDFKCPLCGFIQNRKISTVAYKGFKCERCGDKISYPNKFGRAFFSQLPVDYCAEYHPEWGHPYIYDIHFKLNDKEYLVEWDGLQHFQDRNFHSTTLEARQEIDRMKDELAEKNNIYLIRIDCSKSECEFIKNNILKSDLSLLFDLSEIDWISCDKCAQKNLVKVACGLWMSGMRSFDDLASTLHLGNSTVRDYINRGRKLGWCDYDPKHWIPSRCKPIDVVNVDSGRKYYFDSLKKCSEGMIAICGTRIAEETINKYCVNGKSYNGFIFKYANLTIQN